MTPLLLIVIISLLANIPWLSQRLFLLINYPNKKPFWVGTIELIVWYAMSLLIAMWAELDYTGELHSQQWEFYVTTLCAFFVLATPGIVYRYQWLTLKKS